MKSNQNKLNGPLTPLHREIPADASPSPVKPGEIGQAALAAAALHQLNRCAQEIEEFLEASKMERLVEKMQADLNPDESTAAPKLRLRRD